MKNLRNLTTQELVELAENSYISGYIVSECVKTAYLDRAKSFVEETIANTVVSIINYIASNNVILDSSTNLEYHMNQSYQNMISSYDNY